MSPCSAQGEHMRAAVPRVGSGVRGAAWNPSLVISGELLRLSGLSFPELQNGDSQCLPMGLR